ncbi:MAG: DNA-deoxyinosine glycosylase [Clostridia bacterium]|nr:DNA-deoxyinosine glycosylase [Clostridia bacterium]
MITHPFPPVFDANAKILILGSFPSVKSREQNFYYGHPQNRFWKVVSAIYGESTPTTIAEKKSFLLRNQIAVWDVIASCDIVGSSDSSIKNVQVNDLSIILHTAKISAIYTNGKAAHKYYTKYTQCIAKREAICLPSTSPANALWSLERLIEAWRNIIFFS